MLKIRKPKPPEFDLMTTLRNQHREWFGDAEPVDLEPGRQWLAARTTEDALFAVCWNDHVIGTIGWRDLDDHSSEMGRIIVDRELRHYHGAHGDVAAFAFRWAMDEITRRGRAVFVSVKPNNCACLSLCIRTGLVPATHRALPQSFVTWTLDQTQRLAA